MRKKKRRKHIWERGRRKWRGNVLIGTKTLKKNTGIYKD